MKIESDQVEITSGVRHGFWIHGRSDYPQCHESDHQKWLEIMSAVDVDEKKKGLRKITKPRPGHGLGWWYEINALTIYEISLSVLRA